MAAYDVSEAESKQARHPHEIFLINLIFNHIFLFVAALSVASSYPELLIPIPVLSAALMGYLLWRGKRSIGRDPWFAKCHWQVTVRRSRLFLLMLGIMAAVIIAIMAVSGGDPKPQHWALLGAGMLPTMVTVLVLIVMESDAMHQARHGIVPRWVEERFPNPGYEVIGRDPSETENA